MNTTKLQNALDKLSTADALAQINQLKAGVQSRASVELGTIHTQYGFDSVNSFVNAVRDAARANKGSKPEASKPAKAAKAGKRTRTKITNTIRNRAIAMTKSERTAKEIAASLKISVPSVFNIRKAAGLVEARSEQTAALQRTRVFLCCNASLINDNCNNEIHTLS